MRLLLVCLLLAGCGGADSKSDGSGAGRSGASGRPGTPGMPGAGGKGGGADPGGSGRSAGGGAGSAGSAVGSTGGDGAAGSRSRVGQIHLLPNVIAGVQTTSSNGSGIGSSQSGLRIGSASATTLTSLKYYITSIQLCEDVERAGSGFSNTHGCIALYENQNIDSPDYATYGVSAAKNDTTPGRYIDLMSAAGQAVLRRPVTLNVPIADAVAPVDHDADGGVEDAPAQAGVYRYGLINFYRPIKVTAQFPIIGEPDHYFRTRAVTAIHSTPSVGGGLTSDRVEIGDTLSGPTEETTYMLNNGGALFTFQKPFVITRADVEAQAEIKVDLVFNPENFGQAYDSECANDLSVSVCDPLNHVAIDMPFVHMSPVPRKAGEKTRKETYLLDYDAVSKVRIELYYNDADPEAGIQGVDTAVVYGSNTSTANAPTRSSIASDYVSQTGSISASNAVATLLDYQHMPNLEGLHRRHSGTATIHCLFIGSLCQTLGVDVSRAYTFVSDTIVAGN